jgi:signal transduction histidine kinase
MRLAALRGSLRVRLLAGTLVWIVASILIAGWGLSGLFRQHVALQFHAELKTHLDQLAANLVLYDKGQPALSTPLSDPRLSKPYSGLYWQIDRHAGPGQTAASGVLRSRSLWDGVLAVPVDTPANGEIHQHRIVGPDGAALGMIERVIVVSEAPDQAAQTLRLIVAADEQLMIAPVARFIGSLWLALSVLGFGLVIAAIVQVMIGLAPLRRLRKALGAVRNGETQHLQGDFPAEIQPLVEEFNSVLAQNTEIVARARTSAGNLAHALKTPLSVLANAAAGKDGELARLVTEQVATARRQVDYHLARARVAATVRVPGSQTPLAPVVDGLVRVMRRVHAERELELMVQPMAANLAFRGEQQDLQEMLGNLLDNACKWAQRRIEIQATLEQGELAIILDDDGPGIASARREAMIRRGARADEEVPGSGLGLAIVDDLARLYGGRLELADSPRGGLRVNLTLPAVA